MIHVTKHARKQGKKRLGLKKEDIKKEAMKAYLYGASHGDFKGSFSRYLDKQWMKYRTANNMKVYNQHIYYFRDETLMTIIAVPNRWRHTSNKYQKKHVKINLKTKKEDGISEAIHSSI